MSRLKHLVAVGLLSVTHYSHAYFLDGNTLLERIEDPGTVKPMVALGFILGVADSFAQSEICVPENVRAQQLYDLVRDWLRANPDKRHVEAAAIVLVVLRKTWPCKKNELSPSGRF